MALLTTNIMYIMQGMGCNFFCWFDLPIFNRARQVIPGLLYRVNLLEEKVEAQKRRDEKLLVAVFVCVIVVTCKLFC